MVAATTVEAMIFFSLVILGSHRNDVSDPLNAVDGLDPSVCPKTITSLDDSPKNNGSGSRHFEGESH
jgi:hypothetical protein